METILLAYKSIDSNKKSVNITRGHKAVRHVPSTVDCRCFLINDSHDYKIVEAILERFLYGTLGIASDRNFPVEDSYKNIPMRFAERMQAYNKSEVYLA